MDKNSFNLYGYPGSKWEISRYSFRDEDYIDCTHWATAILYTDIFLTEDKIMYKLNSEKEFNKDITTKFSVILPRLANYKTIIKEEKKEK
jgi:hypothetical protein